MTDQASSTPDRRPTTLDELTAGLVWPVLLRATPIALAPGRVVLGVLAVVATWALAWAFDRALRTAGADAVAQPLVVGFAQALRAAAAHAFEGRLASAVGVLADAFIDAPAEAIRSRPVLTAVIVALVVPPWMLCFGAAARSVAVDIAAGLHLGVRESLRFAWTRRSSLIASALGPIALIIVLMLTLQVAGWLLLNLAGLNVVGGVLYGVMLAVGLVLLLLFLGFVAGHALLAPAVASDGSDAIDAVQRAYAYLFGRPGRAAVYGTVALIQWGIVFLVGRWIIEGAIDLTRTLTLDWLSAPRAEALTAAGDTGPNSPAGHLIAFWESALRVLFAGFMASYWFASSTLLYLLLRRLNDEQDIREVWMPGLIEGTRASERA